MTILGLSLTKSITIMLFVAAFIGLIFSILGFMGKINNQKHYTGEGIFEEKTTPDKKERLISGFSSLCIALTSAIGGLKYLTGISIFGYISVVLLLVSVILFIVSEKQERN